MVVAHTENHLVVGQDSVVKFIYIILFHIDQSYIQGVILYQIAGTDRSVFFQYYGNFRVLFVKRRKQLRKKYGTQHGRDPDAKRGLYPGHAGVIGLKLITILKDIGSFFVEGLSLLGQTQLISFSGKKADPEFNLQIADSHGNGGLGHI